MSRSDQQPESDSDAAGRIERPGLFDSTPWSEVLAAGDSRHADNRRSLEKVCILYWPPLHAYVRRKVRDLHLAQDLTQSFFERLISGRSLRLADPARGRFRSFLIKAFEWHLANEFREGRAIKRGGDVHTFPLDFSSGSFELADGGSLSGEELFDREWALTLLNQTMTRLEAELVSLQKKSLFEALTRISDGSGSTGGLCRSQQDAGNDRIGGSDGRQSSESQIPQTSARRNRANRRLQPGCGRRNPTPVSLNLQVSGQPRRNQLATLPQLSANPLFIGFF